MNQDFPHQLFEIIAVEGVSQDKTLSILKASLRSEHVKSRIFTTNEGLGRSRQIVVDTAKGEYVVWVDGDVVLPRDFVRRQVTLMEENPGAGIGACCYGYRKGLNWVADIQNILYIIGQEYFGSIYRVEALRDVGGFDARIKGACEDVDIVTRIRLAGWSIVKNPQVRLHHNSKRTAEDFLKRAQWYGYGRHFIYHKHGSIEPRSWIDHWKANPFCKSIPVFGFLYGLKKCARAYRLEHRKVFFLMPLLLFLEKSFWWMGFIQGHLRGYGHPQA
jgi:GT2 family glycosyltransferase